MDLQISLFLLFAFVTAGRSLSCYECLGTNCEAQTATACHGIFSKCESLTMEAQRSDITTKLKVKDCSVECFTGSLNLGIVQMSTTCCDSDWCNLHDAPDPSAGVPNGNTCYTCDGKSCSNKVSCLGSEDLCVTATGIFLGKFRLVKGCVSKSFCDTATSVSSIDSFSCCSGNLCNGAKGVTQSFLILCFPLIAFILML